MNVTTSSPPEDPRDVAPATAPAPPSVASGLTLGMLGAAAFYTVAWLVPLGPLQRYFLGHPVAILATVLFAIALAILFTKARRTAAETKLTARLRDSDLAPEPEDQDRTQADRWLDQQDAGRVARRWLTTLDQLPATVRQSPLVVRLAELLQRQAGRASTRHLSDDLRELAARDGDAAHDSLQLVRIIVWAIPMLGFLGTVIGITQTLGGLDFTDGTAAVDRLKSGLYVAFDTTALGLVLSVVAIFLQLPVERNEQRLLSEIDRRAGMLLAAHLPSDDRTDNPAAQIEQLCEGIRVAVGQSLESQTNLWRTTIDEAQSHWKRISEDHGASVGRALLNSLEPIMQSQADAFDQHAEALRQHGQTLQLAQSDWTKQLDQRLGHWDELTQRSTQLAHLQQSLDGNLARLVEVNSAVNDSLRLHDDARIAEGVAQGLSNAMLTLARTVDLLSQSLPKDQRTALRNQLADDAAAPPEPQDDAPTTRRARGRAA